MTKPKQDWKEKIKQEVRSQIDIKDREGSGFLIDACIQSAIDLAIAKTEEHFNELNLLGKRDKDLLYDREMLKRTREETARQIFKDIEKVTGDRSEHSMVMIFTKDYNKIKAKHLKKESEQSD